MHIVAQLVYIEIDMCVALLLEAPVAALTRFGNERVLKGERDINH